MKAKNLQIKLDADEEHEHYLEETSSVIFRGVPPSTDVFGLPSLYTTVVPATAAINIEGAVWVSTEPTPEWFTIYPTKGVFGLPRLYTTVVPATAAINIEGAVWVSTEPTPEWFTIYPSIQLQPSLDTLEDLDVPFRPKKTRRAMGIVVKRNKARFKTAFADDLVEETNISE